MKLCLQSITLSFLLLAMVHLAGCATPIHKSFPKLELGQDKADVLEILGRGPEHSERDDDEDHWTYKYYRNDVEYRRRLTFDQNKLVDIGNEVPIMDKNQIQLEKELESIQNP
ncbi:MAG: hypothetical protein KDD22_04540 [Bdellovibrionales bacterium]|nr:hypothetical protein [Bdellovibrionales bacterium]